MEYLIPKGKHIAVHEGELVKAGEPLMDGPTNPHDILTVLGTVRSYLLIWSMKSKRFIDFRVYLLMISILK